MGGLKEAFIYQQLAEDVENKVSAIKRVQIPKVHSKVSRVSWRFNRVPKSVVTHIQLYICCSHKPTVPPPLHETSLSLQSHYMRQLTAPIASKYSQYKYSVSTYITVCYKPRQKTAVRVMGLWVCQFLPGQKGLLSCELLSTQAVRI
jgi:hypothetical protein